jgi:hypothetical protein
MLSSFAAQDRKHIYFISRTGEARSWSLALMLGLTTLLVLSGEASLGVATGRPRTATGTLMVDELKLYFGKLFPDPLSLSEQDGKAAVVLGTPASNPLIQGMVQRGALVLPQGRNADQGYVIKTVDRTIYVAAQTEIGLLYGLYGLLEAYGAYFQISGDCLPVKTAFQIKKLDLSVAPVFKYRGIMPWDNFLCGSSGYNEKDWQELIRRATRMKLNKLDLHFYPGYVYYNEVWNGTPVPPLWAAQPNDFAPKGKPGAKAFGDMPLFCVKNWEENKGDPVKQAEASQAMLRRVIDYSHSHGWVVASGFALMEPRGADKAVWLAQKNGDRWLDPTAEQNVTDALTRFRRLAELYPNSDYYWMWQSEGGGPRWNDTDHLPNVKAFRQAHASWGEENNGGDRDYAELFRRVVERLTPEERVRVATGGWDIQHLFPGINKEIPKEIIFASLNNADPKRGTEQMPNYRVAQEGRRAWMIAWWEFDGNQWFPQFRTSWHEQKYKKAAAYGVEGVSLLGWKLSAIEHHVRYLAEFAWNPSLTAKEFYRSFAERIYGKAGAEPLARLYEVYDEWEARTPPATPGDDRPMLLGAGWCSLAIPDVPFAKEGLASEKWKHVVLRAGKIIEWQEKLLQEDRQSLSAIQAVLPSLPPDGQSWARLLINRLEFRILYIEATRALNRSFRVYDEVANTKDIKEGAKAAKQETAQAMEWAARAIEKYAEDVRNRGDLGVIGQLNVQFREIIGQLDSRFQLDSPYLTLHWQALRMNVAHRCDLTQADGWPLRDGVATLTPFMDEGVPAVRVALAGTPASKWGSRFIRREAIDLDKQPLMDFYFRTTSMDPVALMFQVEGTDDWFELDLIGKQDYRQLDRIDPVHEINNGQWHRLTWNLQKLVAEKIGSQTQSIKNLVVGTWTNPETPVTVEFKNVCFGSFNQLDGLERDH